MRISRKQLKIARVLHRDDDFVTLEVARHDDVSFHLQQNDEGETVGGDEFLTVLFVRSDNAGGFETWDPIARG